MIPVLRVKHIVFFSFFLWMLGGSHSLGQSAPATPEGLSIRKIAIHPKDHQRIYLSTDNQGVLYSRDGGKNWILKNQGIRSYLLYDFAIDPKETRSFFLGSWGGGVYVTQDGGDLWVENNFGLGNTAVRRIVFSPIDGKTVYLLTSMRVYQAKKKKMIWTPLIETKSWSEEEWPESLIVLPSSPETLILGTNKGVYQYRKGMSAWGKIGPEKPYHVTTLGYHAKSRNLYFGTLRQGVFVSGDYGKSWKSLKGTEKIWVNEIIFHPTRSMTLYLLTRTQGILKTSDGGNSWIALNEGIKEPWVTALVFQPGETDILYAGTYSTGIYQSKDGGKSWRGLLAFAIQSHEERNKALTPRSTKKEGTKNPPPSPLSFKKCNGCHGWTDPAVDLHSPTYYRMTPNQRDWESTVKRMSRRAQLLPKEEKEIIEYLNAHFGLKRN